MNNALAITGEYADLWCHLKAMDRAVERALERRGAIREEELTRDKLASLAAFLREAIVAAPEGSSAIMETPFLADEPTARYTTDVDLRQRLRAVPEFESWLAKSKLGVDRKIARLASAIEGLLDRLSSNLVVGERDLPQEELQILRKILAALLRDTQSALNP